MERPSRIYVSINGGDSKEFEISYHPPIVHFRAIDAIDPEQVENLFFTIHNININGYDHTEGKLRVNLHGGKRLVFEFPTHQAESKFRNFLGIESFYSGRSSSCSERSNKSDAD
ncbi:hypothetical protein QE152_g38490 [Popillia japonica]|uniref:Uncharacterized protein n=1 Tax=Popillia japonica TaxID=7064 RepID=A0AAW1HWD7_POPJA